METMETSAAAQILRICPQTRTPAPTSRACAAALAAVTAALAAPFPWHTAPPRLRRINRSEATAHGLLPHIAASITFGDSIEDEWFLVYILSCLSSCFPDIACRITDADGEFMLIEAADVLPRWLTPETAPNRVFFMGGQLMILPQSLGRSLELPRALSLLADTSIAAQSHASDAIAARITTRLNRFPSSIPSLKHTTRVVVSRTAACVVTRNPHVVHAAIEAFITRDPIRMRPCRSMSTFMPKSPPETPSPTHNASELVTVSVTMSRLRYAQLKSHQFVPPTLFHLPARSSPDYDAHVLGIKLMCGLEIMYHDTHLHKCMQNRKQRDEHAQCCVETHGDWICAVSRVRDAIGSMMATVSNSGSSILDMSTLRDMRTQLQDIYERVSNTIGVVVEDDHESHHDDEGDEDAVDAFIDLHTTVTNAIHDTNMLSDLPEPASTDNDDWMHLDPHEVDADLSRRFTQNGDGVGDQDGDSDTDSDLNDMEKQELDQLKSMFQNFQSFVEKKSGYDGVDVGEGCDEGFADNINHDDDDGDDDDDDKTPAEYVEEDETAPVKFDSSKVAEIIARFSRNVSSTLIPAGSPTSTKAVEAPQRVLRSVRLTRAVDDSDNDDDDDSDDDEDTVNSEVEDQAMRQIMDAMDRELLDTKLARDFKREPTTRTHNATEHKSTTDNINDSDDDDDALMPDHINTHLIRNVLASFHAQEGLGGPASSMMLSMGMRLPRRNDDIDDTIDV